MTRFLKALFSEWGSAASGIPSIPFTVLALYLPPGFARWGFALLAILCGGISSYLVWGREYDRAEAELARHTRPEIVPEVLACFWDSVRPDGSNRIRILVFAWIRLVNQTDVPTLIQGYELKLEHASKAAHSTYALPLVTGEIEHSSPQPLPDSRRSDEVVAQGTVSTRLSDISRLIDADHPLRKGLHVTGWVVMPIDNHEFEHSIFDATVTLTLTDSFGRKFASQPTRLTMRSASFTPFITR